MKRTLIIIGFQLLCSAFCPAQNLELSERWIMNERLLDLVAGYERFSAMEGRSDSYAYLGLFRSPDAPVWCDYVASPEYGQDVKAADYVSYSRDLEDRSVKISNLRKSDFSYSSGRWRASVTFDKQVEYEDSLGFTFTTRSKMLAGDYQITLDCVWVEREEEFLIERVRGKENGAASFPKGNFHIAQQKNEIDSRVLYGGQTLQFNEYGFAILPEGREFDFDDDDYVLTIDSSPGAGRYDVYSFSVTPKKFRVRPRASLLLNPLAVETIEENAKVFSWGLEAGVDFGYAISLSKSVKLVPYFGLGINYSQFSLDSKLMGYGDGVNYSYLGLRTYQMSSASESFAFTALAPAVTLSLEGNVNKQLTVVGEAYAKLYANINARDRYSISFGDVPEGESPYNLLEGYSSPNTTPVNTWTPAVGAKLGADWSPLSGMFAFLHLGVEKGFDSEKWAVYQNGSTKAWYEPARLYPVEYLKIGDSRADVATHSFKDSISKISRGFAIVLEAGVKFKF